MSGLFWLTYTFCIHVGQIPFYIIGLCNYRYSCHGTRIVLVWIVVNTAYLCNLFKTHNAPFTFIMLNTASILIICNFVIHGQWVSVMCTCSLPSIEILFKNIASPILAYKSNLVSWSSTKWTSSSSHWILSCSHHDMAEKLLNWH